MISRNVLIKKGSFMFIKGNKSAVLYKIDYDDLTV